MRWNWQLPDWPNFDYDMKLLEEYERQFLLQSGKFLGAFAFLDVEEKIQLRVELLSAEALTTSEIEGEYLERASVQASLRRFFGLQTSRVEVSAAEQGIVDLMISLYRDYNTPLDNVTLFQWHKMVMSGRYDLHDFGRYRSFEEPMQIVSGNVYDHVIHFEAPPSSVIPNEMNRFISWFNESGVEKINALPALTRAGIAHLYFESLHPFEDGNGRVGRALAEKALAQSLGQPSLIALASIMNKKKKAYYAALAQASRSNKITPWLCYFAETVLEAVQSSQDNVNFLLYKVKLLDTMRGNLNARQEKCILRLFKAGIDGFEGGLSADNYIRITKASRQTATRDLADLVSKNVLVRKGERKSSRYYLKIPKFLEN